MSAILSFCIPTYNRAFLLEQTLHSVLTQLEPSRRSQIEIIVSDNASPDDTTAMVERFRTSHPDLSWHFFRQPENKGADANILNALTLAQGEFVLWLSDDDLLLPGAVEKIFALIAAHPALDAFCLNTRSFVMDPLEETVPDFPVSTDQILSGQDMCLLFLGTRITFISLLVFRRACIVPEAYQVQIGSSLVQAYVYVDVLASGQGMLVTSQPYLATRDNNTGGYNFFEVFVTQFGQLMRYARTRGYSSKAVQAVLSRHLRQFLLTFVIAFQVRGAYGSLQPDFRDGVRRLRKEYGFYPLWLFGVLPLMLLPRGCVRLLSALVRFLRQRAAVRGRVQ